MKKARSVALALVAAGLLLMLLALWLRTAGPGAGPAYAFSVNGRQFNISLVAANVSAQQKGLMNTSITNSTLMLFVFPGLGYYPFWMYDTYSNLDMMWLNVTGSSGRVVYLVSNAVGCFSASRCTIYYPNATADYVLEAKAGFARMNGIAVGTPVLLRKDA